MSAAAGRYARAFAEVVMDRELDADATVRELNDFADLVNQSSELRNVLQNPSVEHKQKIKLLDAIIEKMGGSKMLRNFLAVLIDHHRVRQIEEIATQLRHELDARMGIAEADVSSARTLGPAERKDLERKLAQLTGKAIRASYGEDAKLLGGAVVRIGSTIYDGSVLGQLKKIRQQIAGA